MTILNLEVNKRDYEVAIEEGEEEHLLRLSYELDKRVRALSKQVGTANQSTLLVVAGLQLLDELFEAKHGNSKADVDSEIQKATSSTLSQVSEKLENLAKKLEKKAS
ncbi:MAG: hypothetical protein COV36_03890 [Alphaproteobacteria bacterium CG11_big_fil_rev_8_21_14_0_20_44_7]|nr:MAG: hypothetical protein COV36_03890 [Alphaproteobacteria bacterium CG11_big_fil_rev_8_21_14_0_20_44_7]